MAEEKSFTPRVAAAVEVVHQLDGGRIVALGGGNFWCRVASLGKGKQPVAVHGNGQPIVIWQQDADLALLRELHGSQPVKLASDARFPSLVSLPGGKGAVVAYEHGPAKGAATVTVERL